MNGGIAVPEVAGNVAESLWQPIDVGALRLPHRLAMAPMTRSRAEANGVPGPLAAEYYAQRASMALLITEGTQPSADGQGYFATPGIYTDEQVAGWRRVTDAVHDAGGQIAVQLMHTGRVSHPANTPHGRQPVAPSAVTPAGSMFTAAGMVPLPTPRALTTGEVAETVQDFRRAAAAAIEAGFDAVEIHGANGYLVQQFLSSNANQRTDEYGGSVTNRIRFAVEVAAAVADEIGADRTGVRIGPGGTLGDIVEDDIDVLYPALVAELAQLGLAYLHIVHTEPDELLWQLRRGWPGVLLVNRARADVAERTADVTSGLADVVTVATAALANPDLVTRVRTGAELNPADRATFYGGGARGYTDYPTLDMVAAATSG